LSVIGGFVEGLGSEQPESFGASCIHLGLEWIVSGANLGKFFSNVTLRGIRQGSERLLDSLLSRRGPLPIARQMAQDRADQDNIEDERNEKR